MQLVECHGLWIKLIGAMISFFCKQYGLRNDRMATSVKLKCLSELAFMHNSLCKYIQVDAIY